MVGWGAGKANFNSREGKITMNATLTNGRQRKSLADQIERLDSILDGLADGLNEAVATAVKEAVRAVLTEVLTNPELLARLHPVQVMAIPEPPQPSRWLARAWHGIRSAFRWTAKNGRAGWLRLGQMCGSIREQVAETINRLRTGPCSSWWLAAVRFCEHAGS